jgi:exopolysaccharide biosynthesis polyprenyl glycosylphosphotransferase
MKTSSTPLTVPLARDKTLPLNRQRRHLLLAITLIVCDVAAIGAAFWIAYQLRFILLPYASTYSKADYQFLAFGIIPVWIAIFAIFQLYNADTLLGGLQEYSRVFNAVTIGIFALTLLGFVRRENISISRGWLVISWILAICLLIFLRFCLRRFIFSLRQHGHFLSPTLLVGANAEGRALAEQLRNAKTSGLYIFGFIDSELPIGSEIADNYRVLGRLEDLEGLVARQKIEDVIIAPTALSREELLNIYQVYNANPGVKLRLSSGLFEVLNTGLSVKELAFVPLIEVNQARITGFDAFLKTSLDYALTLVGLLLLSPLFILLALAVRLDSPGPVIYRRRVMGVNGTQFDAFKFRTMFSDGDRILDYQPELRQQLEQDHKLKDDPRVTRVGKFMRKFSLDELPQLFNILRGQMSLVGPRMISPPEMEKYGKWGMNLLTVRPGLTGLWQISGRSDVSYEERVRLDMFYIRNWNLWTDLYLLLATIPAVIRNKGAY